MKNVFSGAAVALAAIHSFTSPMPVTSRATTNTVSASATRPTAAGSIVRAQFTTEVKDRQPSDSLSSVGADKTQITFFTELKGLSGTKVTHRWEYNGKVAFEQTFDVGADRWRAWSTKGLDGRGKGEWKVTVVDGTGATLGTYTLTYGK